LTGIKPGTPAQQHLFGFGLRLSGIRFAQSSLDSVLPEISSGKAGLLSGGDWMAPESYNEVPNSEPANPNAINQGSGEGQSREEQMEERRKIRRLQLMMDMVMSVIGQDPNLTVDEAAEMVADSRRAALAMFPDKELAFNILYKPRLQRLMRERYQIQ
jgi:hypothetical protein